jgi:hypothetical protein
MNLVLNRPHSKANELKVGTGEALALGSGSPGLLLIGGGSPQPHLNAQNLGDGDTTRAAPAFGPVAENLTRAQCRTQHRRDESQCLTDFAHHFEPVSRPRP